METADQTRQPVTEEEQIAFRFIYHLNTLTRFARLPEPERKNILEIVRQTVLEYNDNPFLFPTGIEFFNRLSMIHAEPFLVETPAEREQPATPQRDFENYLAERFSLSGDLLDEGQHFVAENALFTCFGRTGSLLNQTFLILREASGKLVLVEMPFAIADEVIFHGHDAVIKGADRSAESIGRLKTIFRDHFATEPPDWLDALFSHPNFLFYAFDSTRRITDTLDDITLSDDVIESDA